jgi:hypothetical protein
MGRKTRRRAYACQDAKGDFAELSTAPSRWTGWKGRKYNKWYPFNRKQLKEMIRERTRYSSLERQLLIVTVVEAAYSLRIIANKKIERL